MVWHESHINILQDLPPYNGSVGSAGTQNPPPVDHMNFPSVPMPSMGSSIPGLPDIPTDSVQNEGDDVDFDDLTRRFEELKKK